MTGKQIKRLRKRLGWSREKLADELEISSMTLYRWETGKTKPHGVFVRVMKQLEPR